MNIKDRFSDAELVMILKITQLVLNEVRGFRIPERKLVEGRGTPKGENERIVNDLVDIKRKIERVLGIPSTPLVASMVKHRPQSRS